MAELATNDGAAVPQGRGLSQVERVVDTFVAPSKTFTDILRSASWWLPFLLMVVFSLSTTYTVDKKVGFDQVQATQIHNSPKQEEAMSQMTPEQRQQRLAIGVKITRGISYGVPFALVIGFGFYALILWACFNFLLGAQTTFWQVFATCFYAALPYLLLNVLTILTLSFGGSPETYDFKNPAGTNPAYYMAEAAPWLKALLVRIDVIQLWTLALTVFGMSIISKKTIAQAATVVGGIWLLVTVISVAAAAAFN